MNRDDTIATIKQKGYWRIVFEPLVSELKLTIPQCKEIVEKSVVSLRGWDYPFVPNSYPEMMGPGNTYYEAWFQSANVHMKEFWRMYQSGQFIHYVSTHYDWLANLYIQNRWMRDDEQPKGPVLGILDATYEITEIFQFLKKLTESGIYNEGVNVNISINNTKGRHLVVDGPSRIPFTTPKQTQEEILTFEKTYSKDEVIMEVKILAMEVVRHFFIRYNWLDPNVNQIKQDIDNLIDRKI